MKIKKKTTVKKRVCNLTQGTLFGLCDVKVQLFRCLSRHSLCVSLSQDGHVEVARLLLDSGAQVNMPADSFESPLTLAACGGHVELAALLIERGANLEEVCDGMEPK